MQYISLYFFSFRAMFNLIRAAKNILVIIRAWLRRK